jgi:hypothetical protein
MKKVIENIIHIFHNFHLRLLFIIAYIYNK